MKPYKPAHSWGYSMAVSLLTSVMMTTFMTPDEIKALLKLEPHPVEGGFYRRTYTSAGSLDLPRGSRAQGTAIYYLLEAGTFS
jgi:predicted cupin superfamily sugar epimerase